MARVLYGGGVTDVRGSIGGTTFSRNAAGAYARARVKPTDPNTPAQGLQRERVSALSNTWRALTVAQRSAWSQFATEANSGGILKPGKSLTGQQWFMSLNLNISAIQVSIPGAVEFLAVPPTPNPVPGIENPGIVVIVGGGEPDEISDVGVQVESLINPGDLPTANLVIQYQATGLISAGKSRPASADFRSIGDSLYTLTPQDFLERYTAIFGDTVVPPPPPGELEYVRVWIRARVLNGLTGIAGQYITGLGAVEGV